MVIKRRFIFSLVLLMAVAASGCAVRQMPPAPEGTPVTVGANMPVPTASPVPPESVVPDTIPVSAGNEADTDEAVVPDKITEEVSEEEPIICIPTGIRADGSFDATTLFIGDSLTYDLITEYLQPMGLLGDALYAAIRGISLQTFSGDIRLNEETDAKYRCIYSPQFYDMDMANATANAGDEVNVIYFMLGTNLAEYTSVTLYRKMISYLRESCPNAVIFFQTVPYNDGWADYAFANLNLTEAVSEYLENGGENVFLIDTFSAIGYDHNKPDKLHINLDGLHIWYQTLIENDRELNRVY